VSGIEYHWTSNNYFYSGTTSATNGWNGGYYSAPLYHKEHKMEPVKGNEQVVDGWDKDCNE